MVYSSPNTVVRCRAYAMRGFCLSVFIHFTLFVGISAADANADKPKLVIADYFAHHVSRAHDAQIGPWLIDNVARKSQADQTRFVYNADLIDEQGRHQLAAPAYPLLGLQSDMDRDYQEFQILLAKVAHIDGFSLEWAYPGDGSADAILRSMMATARHYDFKLGVTWIEGSFFDWLPKRREDVETREDTLREFGRAVEYLLDEIYASDVGIVVEGHPLILLFSGPNSATPEEFAAAVNPVLEERAGPRPWFLKRGGIGTKESHARGYFNKWAPIIDGTFGWISAHSNQYPTPTPPHLQGKVDHFLVGEHMTRYLDRLRKWNQRFVDEGKFSYRMQSVCPGFDNRGCAGWGNDLAYLGRENGKHYRRQWQQHVEHRDEIDAVLVVTWNDFTEATVIEPTEQYGYREIAATQEYAAKFKGLSYDPAGLKLPERLFRLRKDQAWLTRTGYDVSDAGPTLDRAGLHIASREYALAADLLGMAETRFAALRTRAVEEKFSLALGRGLETVGPGVQAAKILEISKAKPLLLQVDEIIAEKLRRRNFEGTASFDYFDKGQGRVLMLQVPILRKVDEGVRRGAKFWQVCDIHKTATGDWIPARVRIGKEAAALNHKGTFGFDFAFVSDARIRNLRMDFTTYHRAQ